jgi:hypothetical protein
VSTDRRPAIVAALVAAKGEFVSINHIREASGAAIETVRKWVNAWHAAGHLERSQGHRAWNAGYHSTPTYRLTTMGAAVLAEEFGAPQEARPS